MDDLAEDRIYGARSGDVRLFVATRLGLVSVAIAGDRIGRFGVDRRGDVRDVAGWRGRPVVATDEDVLVGAEGTYVGLGFGPAVAVGVLDGRLLAAGPDGRVGLSGVLDGAFPSFAPRSASGSGSRSGGEPGRNDRDRADAGAMDRDDPIVGWTTVARLDAEEDAVRAIDGRLLATAGGVRRLVGETDALAAGGEDTEAGEHLADVGLTAVNDVAAGGVPLAAADGGLYRLGNGWLRDRSGRFTSVARGPDAGHHGAVAAGPAGLVLEARDEVWDGDGDTVPGASEQDGHWLALEPPADGTLRAAALIPSGGDDPDGIVALTEEGTVAVRTVDSLADGPGAVRWASQRLGLDGVRAMVALPGHGLDG